MQVQVHTDNHIVGRESLVAKVEAEVEGSLGRFAERITRVEVHLADMNGEKHGADDKRCLMEARLAGHQPITATHHAADLDEAIGGAAEKLERAIDHVISRIEHVKGNTSMSGE